MRHRKQGRQLRRTSEQRLALLTRIFPSVYEGIAAKGVAALMRLGGD